MKANHPGAQTAAWFLTGAALLALGSCSTPKPAPPAPVPSPKPNTVVIRPTPAPPSHADWRDAPITQGDWTYVRVQDQITHSPSPPPKFVAIFGTSRRDPDIFALICEPVAGRIIMAVPGQAASAAVTVTTSANVRLFSATLNSATGWLEVTLAPRDPILDAMAFSRGRFMIEVAGEAPLYLPSRPEISRVIEACR